MGRGAWAGQGIFPLDSSNNFQFRVYGGAAAVRVYYPNITIIGYIK